MESLTEEDFSDETRKIDDYKTDLGEEFDLESLPEEEFTNETKGPSTVINSL